MTSSEIKITPENMNSFGVGTELEISFGAMYPTRESYVLGCEIVPATQWKNEHAVLLCEWECYETGEMIPMQVETLNPRGVGVQLINLVEPVTKTNSPWA